MGKDQITEKDFDDFKFDNSYSMVRSYKYISEIFGINFENEI